MNRFLYRLIIVGVFLIPTNAMAASAVDLPKTARDPVSQFGLMFSTKRGNRKVIWKVLQNAITRANGNSVDQIPAGSVHAIRHTFISQLVAGGKVSLPEIAAIAGHENSQITMSIYAHFVKKQSTFDPDAMFPAVHQ